MIRNRLVVALAVAAFAAPAFAQVKKVDVQGVQNFNQIDAVFACGGAKGAAIGAATGAGAGTAAVVAGGRNAATLPSGTPVTVRLVKPATVTVEE